MEVKLRIINDMIFLIKVGAGASIDKSHSMCHLL